MSPHVAHCQPKERAQAFARFAKELCQDALRLDHPPKPSLRLLQGYILLAYYHQMCETRDLAWTLTGVCCRLAYDLRLNILDEDLQDSPSMEQWTAAEDWVRLEELRRAWWLVWDLDAFASTLLCRPYGIDRSRMSVLLPVSDSTWFARVPVTSAMIIGDAGSIWKTLQGCPNQDERAWFLVCSVLMVTIHDHTHRQHISPADVRQFETALNCFGLILPQRFQLTKTSLSFNRSNFANSNWIVSTMLMLYG
jgi:hypothetical protein